MYDEVFEFIAQDKNKWYTVKYISEEINMSNNSVRKHMLRLLESNYIKKKGKRSPDGHAYKYNEVQK